MIVFHAAKIRETRTVIETILETEPNINQYDIISITLIPMQELPLTWVDIGQLIPLKIPILTGA
jgi:hypothetical protein